MENSSLISELVVGLSSLGILKTSLLNKQEMCANFAFTSILKMIKSHWTGINNYNKSNNGILECINSMVKLARKRATGYRNINNFINMTYFITGKIKCFYPQYFR